MGTDSRRSRAFDRREFLRLTGAGVAGASLLSACGTWTSHVGEAFTGAESSGADTLVFSHGPETSGTLEAIIAKFNKDNGKGITVEWRQMPADSGQYFDKLKTEFQAGGGGIDVISGDTIWPGQFAAQGWIQDLGDLFTEEMRGEYLEAPILANTYKGKIYSVPFFSDAGMLYYRKDLLEKAGAAQPPKTWDEVISISQKLMNRGDADLGVVFQGAEYEGGVCNGCEHIWAAGGDVLESDNISQVIVGEEEALQGLETYRMLVEEGVAPEVVSVYKEQETHTAYLSGDNIVFARNWPYMFGLAADPALSKVKPEQLGVVPVPVGEAGQQSFSALGGWNFFINATSSKKEQAWEFIQYMAKEEIQATFAVDASLLPPKKALYEDKKLLKDAPAVELAKEVMQNAKPRPRHPFYSDMSLILSQGFNDVLKGEETPEVTADYMQAELQRIADVGKEVFNLAAEEGSET